MVTQTSVQAEPLGFLWWPERQQQFDFLLHLLTYSHLAIVLEGPSGAGKTEIVKKVITHLEGLQDDIVWLQADQLNQSLEAEYAALVQDQTKPPALLIIDDAHSLGRQDWRQIEVWLESRVLRLLLTSSKRGQYLAAGTRLHQMRLKPLPPDQASFYWRQVYGQDAHIKGHRCPAAVWPGDLRNPGAHSKSMHTPKSPLPYRSIALLSIILCSLGLTAYLRWPLLKTTILQPETELPENSFERAPSEKEPILDSLERLIKNDFKLPTTQTKNQSQSHPGKQAASMSANPIAKMSASPHAETEDALAKVLSDTLSQPSGIKLTQVDKSRVQASPDHFAQHDANELRKNNQSVKPVLAAKKSTDIQSKQLTDKEQALLALPDSYYSYQVLGTRSEANAQAFIKRYQPAHERWVYYQGYYRKALWYVVVTDHYPNRQAAKKALSKFSKAVIKQQPWLRSFVNIKADIRNGKNKK